MNDGVGRRNLGRGTVHKSERCGLLQELPRSMYVMEPGGFSVRRCVASRDNLRVGGEAVVSF
jgi:hypothetical protein